MQLNYFRIYHDVVFDRCHFLWCFPMDQIKTWQIMLVMNQIIYKFIFKITYFYHLLFSNEINACLTLIYTDSYTYYTNFIWIYSMGYLFSTSTEVVVSSSYFHSCNKLIVTDHSLIVIHKLSWMFWILLIFT